MAKLTEDQQKQLDELSALRDAPDEPDDFDVEIFNEKGSGAVLPHSVCKPWLKREFGIDLGETEARETREGLKGDKSQGEKSKADTPKRSAPKPDANDGEGSSELKEGQQGTVSARYFGRRR